MDQPAERTQSLEAVCAMLLRRYGVVFREVLTREEYSASPWREVLNTVAAFPEDRGRVCAAEDLPSAIFFGEQYEFALPVGC